MSPSRESELDFECADDQTRSWIVTPLSELDLSVRAKNVLANLGLKKIGDLIACSKEELRSVPHCGTKTVREIETFLAAHRLKLNTSIKNWNPHATVELKPGRMTAVDSDRLRRLGPILDAAKLIEEELNSILALQTRDRNVKLLARLWGWSGRPPLTLEAAGREFNLTRERVRQIERTVSQRISKLKLAPPLVLAAAREIRRACPATAGQLRTQLQSAGLSRVGVHPRGIATACELLGIPLELRKVSFGKISICSLEELSLPLKEFESEAKRRTQSSGCVNFEAICDELGMDDSIRAKFRVLITETKEFDWLNEEKTWFYSQGVQRNRLLNISSKVLAVCPKIRSAELRAAVARSRRLEIPPPLHVFERLVLISDLARTQGDFLVANANAVHPPEPGSTEDIFVSVLRQHGPALSGPVFEELCIKEGMNPITFYLYRSGSPIISQLAPGVYGLVGAMVPPGLIEELATKSRCRRLVGHGWDDKGHLWCVVTLSRAVITSGSIALPTFVKSIVQGDWTVALPDGSRPAQATAKDAFLYPIRKPLAYLGAEPDDFLLLEFDIQTHVLSMRVGGHELIEAAESGDLDRLIED